MLKNVILDRPRNIFKRRSCSYCKCIYVLTSTFLWILRMLCNFFLFVCLFMFNVNLQSTRHIFLTSETRGHIFQKSLVALELRAHRHALLENRINSFSRAAERETERGKLDVMQLWPRVSQLNKPYLMKTWCATAFNNGCNTTTVCLLVCRRPHKKKYFAKL